MFRYYESGIIQTFSYRKVYRMFCVMVDIEQKTQGTTFESWLEEMEQMQILIKE